MKTLISILEGILNADYDVDELILAKQDQQQIQKDFEWVKKLRGDAKIVKYEAAALLVIDKLLEAADAGKYNEYELYRVSAMIKGLFYWCCHNYNDITHWSEREYTELYFDREWWDEFLDAEPGSGYWRILSDSSAYNYILDPDYMWTITNQDRDLYDTAYKKYLKQILGIVKKYNIKIYG